MLEFIDYTSLKLTCAFCKRHKKTYNDKQIYMELKNMKLKDSKRMADYYERIQKLAHGLRVPTTNKFLTTMFIVGL
jgi:ribonuclease HIII